MIRNPRLSPLCRGVLPSLLVLLLAATLAGCVLAASADADVDDERAPENTAEVAAAESAICTAPTSFTFQTSGDETAAYIGLQPVAFFTAHAYAVRMVGPMRTFTWGNPVAVTIMPTLWVRTLPAPFDPMTPASALTDWLNAARAVNCQAPVGTPDVLAIAMEYVEGTSKHASYDVGADFYDYLGTTWQPPDASLQWGDPAELGKLDCSGYMRLVWGHRANFTYAGVAARIPLSLRPLADYLPRDSRQLYADGTGKLLVPFRLLPAGGLSANGGAPTPAEIALLRVGDLVFFDTNCDYGVASPTCVNDPSAISHVGIYLGPDVAANHRFISARPSSDGPTFGNASGWATVNISKSSTFFPKRFRAARRL